MVATLKGTRCGGAATQWAVFRFTGGKWHRVLLRRNGATLAKQGADISERVDFPRPGERCLPTRCRQGIPGPDDCSGAGKVRTWQWTGRAFTPTAFQVIPDGPNPDGGGGRRDHVRARRLGPGLPDRPRGYHARGLTFH
jgi:hypothetical protein